MGLLKLTAFLPCPSLPYFRPTYRFHSCAQTTAVDGLPNVRDLATASPSNVRPGRLFRGATPAALPENPSTDAIQFLRSTVVLLDLRSRDERRMDIRPSMVSACGPDFDMRERHIGLLNKRRVVWGLARVLPAYQVGELMYRIAKNPLAARTGVVNRMDEGGLILLNRILVEAGASSIGRAMNAVTDGVKDGKVFFYCSAGKDRTGLLAALILKTMGVDETDIIVDYARSAETWEQGPYHIRADYSARLTQAGLTPMNWVGAPPEVMEETLLYIKKRFGSVEDYLVHCGFGKRRMDELRQAMSAKG